MRFAPVPYFPAAAMPDNFFRAVIEGMGEGVIVVDAEGAVLAANPAACRLFGLPSDCPMAGFAWPEQWHSPEGRKLNPSEYPLRRALEGTPCDQLELVVRAPGREDMWVSVTAGPITLEDGSHGAVGVFRDLTRIRQLEKAPRTEDRLSDLTDHKRDAVEMTAMSAKVSALMDHLSTGVLFTDPSNRIQLVNRAFCTFFGFSGLSELAGCDSLDDRWIPAVRDREAFRRVCNLRMREGIIALADRVDLTDGRILERDYVPVNVEGVVSGHFWCFRDVTERERAGAKLAELSNRDDLTALYNRRGFITLAEQWLRIAARTRRTPLLLFVDVNGMKPINDRFGHAQGDRALRDTADLLRLTFRESDILARLGGDEFVVLAVDALSEHSVLLCERLHRNVNALNETAQRPYRVSLSVGVSAWDPAKPRSVEELLAEADSRMYEAKRSRQSSSTLLVASGV
jgi:diguanylate cyclase (GGDEF)-like protein/PAS domain S-box-containing protein